MKLHTLLLGLLVLPAFTLAGCSDYEDTETESPAAAADAQGVHFGARTNNVTLAPGETWTMTLNRAESVGTYTANVDVLECAQVNGANFCTVPSQFSFADGELEASATVPYSADCVFQTPYSLTLQVNGGEKDHLYAAGYTTAAFSMTIDYNWKSVGTVFATDSQTPDELLQLDVEVVSNYDEASANTLIQIPSVWDSEANIVFVVDKTDFLNARLLTAADIENVPVKENKQATDLTTEVPETEGDDSEEDATQPEALYLVVKSILSEAKDEDGNAVTDETSANGKTKYCTRTITITYDLVKADDTVYMADQTIQFTQTFSALVSDTITPAN